MPSDVKKIMKVFEQLDGQMGEWRSYWQDLADFCLPRKAYITSPRIKGERLQFNYLYDSNAIRALKIMAAGFHSNLTNPATKWFAFETKNKELMKSRAVQLWFSEVNEIMYNIVNATNLDTVAQEFYMDFGCFGTGVILSLPDPEKVVQFTTIPIDQICLEDDAFGNIVAVYRKFQLTARQAHDMWGDNAGKTVTDLIEQGKPHEKVDFIHYVGPRYRRDAGKIDNLNMPFESCYIAVKIKHLISESGFHEMPYHVGRFWKDPTDTFGFSPAMDVLADIKLINAQKRTALRRAMKETDPPLLAPNKGYTLPFNLNPSAMNYRDPNTPSDGVQPFGVGAGSFSITREMMELTIESIKEGFYVPLFQALSQVDKQMTIPEIQRRIMENMVLLAPVVGRVTTEQWSPALMRLFGMAFRDGRIPDPPEEIQGEELDVAFLGQLAKAQRESDINTIQSYMVDVANISKLKPETMDVFNGDRTARIVHKIRGLNPELINSEEETQAIREQRAQEADAARQADMAHKIAATAKTGAEAGKAFAEANATQ